MILARKAGTFGLLATPMMACPPPLMEFESSFLGLLSGVNGHQESAIGIRLFEGNQPLVDLEEAGN